MPQNKDRITFFALSGAVFIYILVKSVFSPFIFDEATTFLIYVHRNEVLPWQGFWAANNHFLNTALTWISYKAFGMNEWALRLPNLLSLPIFLIYLFKTGGLFKDRILKWMFWITILGMHFLIEFFGLSRGYGLSFSFLMAFVWYFIKFQEHKQFKHALVALIWLAFGTAANLNLYFLFVFFSLYSTVVLVLRNDLKAFITGVLTVYLVPFFTVLLLKLKVSNQLFIGKDLTLYHSVESLVNSLFAIPGTWFSVYLIGLTIALTLVFCFAVVVNRKETPGTNVFGLFLVNVLALIIGHHYFEVNYPLERTGLHIFFIFIIALFLIADTIPKRKVVLIVLLPILFIPLRFLTDASIHSSSFDEWSQQQVPNSFYDRVNENEEFQATVAGPLLNSDPWSYLNLKFNKANLSLQGEGVLWKHADFIVVSSLNKKNIPAYFIQVDESNSNNLWLYQNFDDRQKLIKEEIKVDTSFISRKKYLTLLEVPISDRVDLYNIETNIKLESDENPLIASLVVEVSDRDGETVLWRETRLDYLADFKDEAKEFNIKLGIDVFPETAATMSVYIYNFKKLDLNIIQTQGKIESVLFVKDKPSLNEN